MGRQFGKLQEDPKYSNYSGSRKDRSSYVDEDSSAVSLEEREPLVEDAPPIQHHHVPFCSVSRPYFIVAVTIVDVAMMVTALILNKGLNSVSR